MDVTLITILGMTASTLSTASLLPQVIRTWRTRSAGDISALWLVVALASMMLWISYGALLGAQAIIWANTLTAIQAGFILVIKLTEGRKPGSGVAHDLASASPQATSGRGNQPV
ncbi:MAG: SemiSWEET family sugar transporter [Stellaceae bacterium]